MSGAGAHNTHVGDARNTDMGRTRGEFTVGQLLREKFGAQWRPLCKCCRTAMLKQRIAQSSLMRQTR